MEQDKLTEKPKENQNFDLQENGKKLFAEGNEIGKLGGRPKGSRDFYTDFKEAILSIKDKNTGEALDEIKIIKIGLEKMLKGDARFEGLYKDLLDRVYGKPKQTIESRTEATVTITEEDKKKAENIINILNR